MGLEQCFEGTCIVGDPDCKWESIPKFRSNTLKSAISQSTFSFTFLICFLLVNCMELVACKECLAEKR